MTDEYLTQLEAADLGNRLEEFCGDITTKQNNFLKAALQVAAADAWLHANGPLPESSIRDLVLDIHRAEASDVIGVNPLPLPKRSKGQLQ